MPKVDKFEDLECWKEARILVRMVYAVVREGRLGKDFGLIDQMQRSAVSVMANIAEGFECRSDTEFGHYLRISLKSCSELRSHLYVCLDLGYINQLEYCEFQAQAMKCNNLVRALLKYLRSE